MESGAEERPDKKTCVIYASSANSQERIQGQILECKEWISKQDHVLLKDGIFTDLGSGMSLRPNLLKLLELSSVQPPGFDLIVMRDSSRISRNIVASYKFIRGIKAPIEIYSIYENIVFGGKWNSVYESNFDELNNLILKESRLERKRNAARKRR